MKLGHNHIFLISFFIVACIGQLFAQTSNQYSVSINDVRAEPSVGSIKISWRSDSEVNVDHYVVYRSTDINGYFSEAGRVSKGTFFFDDNVSVLYKTLSQFFCYKVIAVDSNNKEIGQSNIVGTSYNSTSSTAKRTWGSIKAMFRY
jgi:hypothetical protein